MIEYTCGKKRFIKDTKDHQLTILKDDGLYRHLRCSRKDSYAYGFDIVTWPGYLTVCGDMGCYTFSRTEDMFKFFIMSDSDFNKDNIINPAYWGEKIQSNSVFKGTKEFSLDRFEKEIISCIEEYYSDEENIALRDECILRVKDEILFYAEDESPECLYKRVYDFDFDEDPFFNMCEFSTSRCEIYTFHYIWLCYAIVWGITEYNKIKSIK